MGSSDRSKSDKRRLEEENGTSTPSNGSHDGSGATAHLDKKLKVSSPRDRDRDRDRHRDKDRHRSKDRRDRDRDRDRDRYRDKDRHRSSKDKDRRDRDRREKEKGKENDTDKGKEKEKENEKTEEEIKMELEAKKEQEAKKKEEEEREEQERLEEEMRKRRERVEAWRREREEQTRKKKEEEETAAAAAAAEASKKKWSLDDDEEDEEETATKGDETATKGDETATKGDETATKGDVTATTKEEVGKMLVEEEEEEERDPLDAFMVGIEETVKKLHNIETSVISTSSSKGTGKTIIVKRSISSSSSGESRANTLASSSKFDSDGDEDEDEGIAVEDDDHLQPKWKRKKALALVDHSKMIYTPFRKNFYIEVPEIARMSEEEVTNYRKSLDDIKVRGRNCPKPIKSFSQAGLSNKLLDVLKKKKFERPTPIQAQAIPAAMSGRDVIGIAKTGSGKTLSFLLPMLRHILDQPPLNAGDGPVGVVMAPTRELAMQIGADIKPFAKACGLRCVCVYGGSGVANQIGDLKRGAEIVVCTPGRMIDMLCSNSGRVVNLRRTTFVVLDEADRMFDMGFEPQIMRIIDNVRPDRQTVMFSATFPKVVETAARKILTKPIDIVVGGRSIVCNDITQIIEVRGEETKFRRLVELLREWYDKGNVLVFANTQESTDLVFTQLTQAGYPCLSLHGGKDQLDRDFTIQEFKAKEKTLMVATSIAARGLDVKDLKLVVNFDVPNHYEDYVHRVGRTGRAGNKGTAVTFITSDEERFAPDLMKALTASNSPVPPELQALAEGLQKKKTEGQSVQTHGSGFGGKGFKFDETEEAKRQEQLKAQKKSWGVEEEEEEPHAVEKVEGEGTTSATSQTSSSTSTPASGPPTMIAGVTLPPGLAALNPALLTQLANAITALHNTGGEGATATAKETAQQFINQMIAEVQKMPASTPPAQKAQFVGTILSIQSGMMKAPVGKLHFDAELEINDFSQQARWKVTHKDALSNITEWTGAAITTRGLFFGPGVKVPPGERKLYLYIEGSSEHSVQTAKKEIKRILDEASLTGPGQERGPVGRYQVL